jgi:predicted CoA-binding protein
MDLIDEILDNVKTIAVVGLSDNPARDSHGVSAYMQSQGYRIIPVNPALRGATVLGEQSYADLESAAAAAQAAGTEIDLVDVFRRSEFAGAVSDDAVSIGARYIWMQDGVVDEAAAERAREAGVGVIMDDCILRQHKRRRGG